jgi:hypothetical protein
MKHSSEEQHSHQTLSDAVSEIREAVLEAEASSVCHPETQRQAKAHIIVRVSRVVSGIAVCAAGVALTVLPGPGIPLLLAGLSILAVDIPFAAKLRTALLARTSKVTKHLPRAVKLVLATLGILAVLGASAISLLLLVVLD